MSQINNLPKNGGRGRPKGSPNKATTEVRAAIAKFANDQADDFVRWVQQVAEQGDPAKAAELYLKAIEYYIPKLARTEVSGPDGGPVQQQVDLSGATPEQLRMLAQLKITGES